MPDYIFSIIRDYFVNRVLLYQTNDGSKRYNISAEIPQRSVLCFLLCNVMYDAVLKLILLFGAQSSAFADDKATMVAVKYLPDVTLLVDKSINVIRGWLMLIN